MKSDPAMTERQSLTPLVPDPEATVRALAQGSRVFNRFVLQRQLGRGGMGIVWLAHDEQLEHDIALKLLPEILLHDAEAVQDLKRETKQSLRLNHHHIVRIYDFHQDALRAGISMEFVDGATLAELKLEQPLGTLSPSQVLPWIAPLCDALSYAHSTALIVHYDIKPANLMLTTRGEIKIADFGISRSLSEGLTRVSLRGGGPSGTPLYMSPQQARGEPPTPLDDVYALGATLYDLLTGKPPFFSGNVQHQLEAVVPPPMQKRRAELSRTGEPIPPDWEATIAACLDKDPSRRPQTAEEVGKRLLGKSAVFPPVPALSSLPFPATQKVAPGRKWHPPRDPVAKTFAAIVAAVALAAGGGIWWLFARAGSLQMETVVAANPVPIPPTAPPPRPTDRSIGTVAIDSEPSGAMVTLGSLRSKTPARFESAVGRGGRLVERNGKSLLIGTNSIHHELRGYEPGTVAFELVDGQLSDLGKIRLERSLGILHVDSAEPDLRTELIGLEPDASDEKPGQRFESSSNQYERVPTGIYELRFKKPGVMETSRRVRVDRGVQTVAFAFEALPAPPSPGATAPAFEPRGKEKQEKEKEKKEKNEETTGLNTPIPVEWSTSDSNRDGRVRRFLTDPRAYGSSWGEDDQRAAAAMREILAQYPNGSRLSPQHEAIVHQLIVEVDTRKNIKSSKGSSQNVGRKIERFFKNIFR